jgi:hypothetical protein
VTLQIERLRVRVMLDDPAPAVTQARDEAGRGDESWQRWVAEYERGEAVIVALEVALEVFDGRPAVIDVANRGVFIETNADLPKVEQQVAELVSKDFPLLARELAVRGHRVDPRELDEMYVHVELDHDLRSALRAFGESRSEPAGRHPDATAKLSRTERRSA